MTSTKSYMVLSGEGDVLTASNHQSIFATYEQAKSLATEANQEAVDYNHKYNVRNAYVIAVDSKKPYSAIGTY